MGLLEWLLSGGWAMTLIILIYREGMHNQEHKGITTEIENLQKSDSAFEEKMTGVIKKQSEQAAVNATILTQLGYITKQLDAVVEQTIKRKEVVKDGE